MENKKRAIIQIVLIYVCSLVLALILEKIISVLPFLQTKYFSLERLFVLFLLISCMGVLIFYRKFLVKNLHWAFLAIAVPLGVAMIIIFPRTAFVSQDDIVHFPLAYHFLSPEDDSTYGTQMVLTQETAATTGQSLAERDATYARSNEAHTIDIVPTTVSNTEIQPYKTIIYLPFYIGFKIGNFLHLHLTTSIALAKVCNFLCYAALMFFAIYLSKSFKKLFFLLALFTTNIFYATQFSYDPTMTASILLSVAIFLRLMESQRISSKLAFLLLITLSWGCLAKAIYCPLFLLTLLLPNSRFDTKKRAIAYKICSVVLMAALASTFILPMLSGGMASDLRGGLASVSGQISAIISSPLHVVKTFALFLIQALPGLIFGQNSQFGFGEPSGAVYVYAKYVLNLIFFVEALYIIYTASTTSSNLKLHQPKYKLVLAGLYLVITLAIMGAMYLSFTPVGSSSIEGVQPRYFLPILPLFLLLIVPFSRRLSSSTNSYLLLILPSICIALVLLTFTARITLL